MNKGDLVEALEPLMGGREAAADALEAILDTIMREVANGRSVGITGFGTFAPATRGPRLGRNPRTGKTVQISASAVPKFKASNEFRSAVAEPGQAVETGKTAVVAQRRKRKPTPREGPRITVVSGGLPGLGKRR